MSRSNIGTKIQYRVLTKIDSFWESIIKKLQSGYVVPTQQVSVKITDDVFLVMSYVNTTDTIYCELKKP